MGDKLATRITNNIQKSKQIPLSRLIFGLGIFHVGHEIADFLAQTYDDLAVLESATVHDLVGISGVGPIIAASIFAYFQTPENQNLIHKLVESGVITKQDSVLTNVLRLPLAGKTFVVTGTLSQFSRLESESRIKQMGGRVTSSVTGNTDYLVAGESPGSKLANATRLGTQILDEQAFLELLGLTSH